MMVVLVVSVQHTCDELESTVPSDILDDDDDDVVLLWCCGLSLTLIFCRIRKVRRDEEATWQCLQDQ
jgi:hypothetical protein